MCSSRCRRTLQWTYAHGFFSDLPPKHKVRERDQLPLPLYLGWADLSCRSSLFVCDQDRVLFENDQAQLEMLTDSLHECVPVSF